MRKLLTFRLKYHFAREQVERIAEEARVAGEEYDKPNRKDIRDRVRRAQRKNNGRHKE